MKDVNFYYTMTVGLKEQKLLGSNVLFSDDDILSAMISSKEYATYEACSEDAVSLLMSKFNSVSAKGSFKLLFEKNQFENEKVSNEWQNSEIVKIYMSDLTDEEYNKLFEIRIFFVPAKVGNAFYMDAPITLQ